MAQFAAPRQYQADHSIILVDQDDRRRWTVHENEGRVEGDFAVRAAALRFADAGRDRLPGAIVIVTPERVALEQPAAQS